jgi:uncharacterized membrane protein YkgB
MRADRANALARRLLRPFGIPAITPLALAVFRTLLGLGLLYILLVYQPIVARSDDVRRPHSPLADTEWVYALAVNHAVTSVLQDVACIAAVLFIAGVYARPAYVVVVLLMLVNVLMILARSGGHDWGLPIVTLSALTVVPWSEAPNLFQLSRSWARFSAGSLASRVYGLAVWLPELTVGLAFAAAAYAKVGVTGIRWITNGTVRYHFVEDGRNAPVTLGLWIATHGSLAIALSLAAVLAEALFILVIFARGWRARAAFGLMGASLMAGFTLFQGVAWWPWRILFLAFLPWTLLTSHEAAAASAGPASFSPSMTRRDLTWVHAALVVALIGTQLWASARVIEIEPFISNYPMYAYTWSSTEEFDRHQSRTRFEAGGTDISNRIEAADGEDTLRRMAAQNEDSDSSRAAREEDLADFSARYRRMYGSLPPAIDVILVRRPFDWQRGRYLPQTRERIGTVHLAP